MEPSNEDVICWMVCGKSVTIDNDSMQTIINENNYQILKIDQPQIENVTNDDIKDDTEDYLISGVDNNDITEENK